MTINLMLNIDMNNMFILIVNEAILKLIAKGICHKWFSLYPSIIDVVTWSRIQKIDEKKMIFFVFMTLSSSQRFNTIRKHFCMGRRCRCMGYHSCKYMEIRSCIRRFCSKERHHCRLHAFQDGGLLGCC